jgi:hypothetical protein
MCASSSTAKNCFMPSWNCLRCFSSRLQQQSRLGVPAVGSCSATPESRKGHLHPAAALFEALQSEWQQNFHEAAWIPGARAARTGKEK